MRDYPLHHIEILGGLFGMRIDERNTEELRTLFANIIKANDGRWGKGFDQVPFTNIQNILIFCYFFIGVIYSSV